MEWCRTSRGGPERPGTAIVADRFEISGNLLARNAILNIAGQSLPLIIGLASVPAIVHAMGAERFGLLVFTWTLIGAFSVLDLGLGWSVTKFVAEALGRSDHGSIPEIVWPAIVAQAMVGTIGAALLILAAPSLVMRLLSVAPQMHAEAILTFQITGLSLPVVLMTVSFRGALEAAQRFDITTWVKAASSASVFLVPLAGVLVGWDLPHIVMALLVVRLLLLGVFGLSCVRVFPVLARLVAFNRERLMPLFTFGGWVMVAALTGLVLGYVDRVVIGSALTMTALTYYTVPQEVIGRVGLITATVAAVLLPAFSTLGGARDLPRLSLLFSRSAKFVILLTAPAFALVAVFAQDLLRLWLGPALAEQSAPVLRILALGAGLQVLAAIPSSMVQGLGRPDLTAKFYLLETPVYLGAVWWLVRVRGIEGAALAWSGRFALDGLLLLWAARHMGLWSWRTSWAAAGRVIIPVAGVLSMFAVLYALPLAPVPRVVLVGSLLAVFYWCVWAVVLGSEERSWVLRLASEWRRESAKLS